MTTRGVVYEFFQALGSWGVTVFVVTSMLNVGLTQKPSRSLGDLGNRAYLEPAYEAGLLLFSLTPAPRSSSSSRLSDSDIALGASVLSERDREKEKA